MELHFGLRAVNEFAKRTNKAFHDTITTTEGISSLDSVVTLLCIGLNEASKRKGCGHPYTLEDCWEMVDDAPELILTVTEYFMESVTPLMDKLGMGKNLESPAETASL